MKMNLGRFLVGALSVFLLGSAVSADPVTYLSPAPQGYTNVYASGLSVTYFNIGGGVGQLKIFNTSTTGTLEGGDPAAGGGVPLMPLSFSLTADFKLSDGTLLASDAALNVNGTIFTGFSIPSDLTAFLHSGNNLFYQSGTVARYGDQSATANGDTALKRIDFTYTGNSGQIFPGFPVYVIVQIGSLTSDKASATSQLLDGTSVTGTSTGDRLWFGTATADVFTPLPRSIYMGFVLLCGLGAMQYRRVQQQR